MVYVIAFFVGLVGGVVGETIRKRVALRRELKVRAAIFAANRKAIQDEIEKPWDRPVLADAFTFVRPELPLSALEVARRRMPKSGPAGTAGDSGAAKR